MATSVEAKLPLTEVKPICLSLLSQFVDLGQKLSGAFEEFDLKDLGLEIRYQASLLQGKVKCNTI